ncbi:MAG TPA: hypothetical protein VF070_24145 [Streptosporangiaceae bacterium]
MTTRVVRERRAADGTARLIGETAVSLLCELVAAVEQPWEDRVRVRDLAGHVDASSAGPGMGVSPGPPLVPTVPTVPRAGLAVEMVDHLAVLSGCVQPG